MTGPLGPAGRVARRPAALRSIAVRALAISAALASSTLRRKLRRG
ncbi:MAG: hypothetical protein ABIP07_04110 [Sphingomicrobium sp.]